MHDLVREPEGWRCREEKQRQILDEVRRVAPAVLQDLAGEPRRLYLLVPLRRLGSAHRSPDPARVDSLTRAFVDLVSEMTIPWSWPDVRARAAAGDRAFAGLARSLEGWAQRWFKDAPSWLLDTALATLGRWRENPDRGVGSDWAPDDEYRRHHAPLIEDVEPFEFRHAGLQYWSPVVDRKAWLREADLAFAAAKDRYLADCDAMIEVFEVDVAPERRKGSRWHVGAFVRSQVLDEPRADIAADLEVTPTAVLDACKSVGKVARIQLREERKGRPKGVEETKPRHVGGHGI